MNRILSALLVSGGLAAAATPLDAKAHDPDVVAGIIAGVAVGALLTEAAGDHGHHHVHAYPQPVYVAPQPVVYHVAPAPHVRYVHVVEPPHGHYKPKHHHHRHGHRGKRHW